MRFFCVVLALFSVLGCAPTRHYANTETRSHLKADWFPWRAKTLGVSVDEAVARDQRMPWGKAEAPPPYDQLDAHTGAEAAALWRDRCAQCHGVDGTPPPPLPGQPEARAWGGFGVRMGFTFGGDKMRGGIFESIAKGKGTGMPAWGEQLSREQIWALVRHIESL